MEKMAYLDVLEVSAAEQPKKITSNPPDLTNQLAWHRNTQKPNRRSMRDKTMRRGWVREKVEGWK